jgi:hypothetical protein
MEKSSFFNSVLDQNGNPDRPYLAEDFARYFSAVIGNGVFPNPSNNLQVISNNNMTITIKQGKAWINGYFYYNTDDLILPIEVADGVLNRIDRIVLRLDFINREIKAKVKKGTFASSPTAPILQRDADAYELAFADITVNKGTISITQGSITDKRLDNSLCGIVHGVVDQVDITTLFNQYTVGFQQKELQFEQEFQTWFATIQGQLAGDVAGNLSNQIINLAGAGRTTETVKGNADAIKTLTTQMGEMATDITSVKTNKADKSDLSTKVNNTDYSKLHVYVPTITGSSTAYVGSVANGQTSYVDGQPFTIIPNVDCGNIPTFNFNNIGALTIVKQDGSAIASGDIKAGKPLSLVRVGSNFFIRSVVGGDLFYQVGDTTLYSIVPRRTDTSDTAFLPCFKLQSKVSGNFRLSFMIKTVTASFTMTAEVRINEVFQKSFSYNSFETYLICKHDVKLKKDDVLSVYFKSGVSGEVARCNSPRLSVLSIDYFIDMPI